MTVIKDSVAIITGASRGIGFAVCEKLGKGGARLILAARDRDALEEARDKLSSAGVVAIAHQTDITCRFQVTSLIKRAIKEFGRIDILVNNAAIGLFQTIADSQETDVAQVMATNFLGTLYCIQECLPVMRKQQQGHIINISSIIGCHSVYNQGIYAASKAAVDRISQSLQAEEAIHGIKVSVVTPDRTATPFMAHALGPPELVVLPGGNIRQLTSADVAAGLVRAIETEELVHYSSLKGKIFSILSCTLPGIIRFVLRPRHE